MDKFNQFKWRNIARLIGDTKRQIIQEKDKELRKKLEEVFDRMEGFAVNEDIESQLVIERDTFDSFKKEKIEELKECNKLREV